VSVEFTSQVQSDAIFTLGFRLLFRVSGVLRSSAMAANFQAIAQQFVQFYYPAFDAGRANVANMYQAGSMLTFVEANLQGKVWPRRFRCSFAASCHSCTRLTIGIFPHCASRLH
jgi:hypothetical protein